MYLMIDNFDSFTYNLYALFKECSAEIKVIKNNEYIPADDFDAIILSPGPSSPENSGTTLRYLKEYTGKKPIFGVCLGMQCIGYSMGYDITSAETIKHGKVDEIEVMKDSILFKHLPKKFKVVRYHSLAVDIEEKYITSKSLDDKVVMSIEDKDNHIFGVQFHPESILSENGKIVAKNFMTYVDDFYKNKTAEIKTEDKSMDGLIKKVNSLEKLTKDEAVKLFSAMAEDRLTEAQIASTLIAIKARGETVTELASLVEVLNKHKKHLSVEAQETVDTCGTGGDGKSTVNVSTAVSIILAALGYNVVKHGNRAQSGIVGSADILAELGLDLTYGKSSPEKFFKDNNFIFMMAPLYHPALKPIGKVRKELKVPTIFNFVGPLVNPANPTYQIIGINKMEKLDFIADTILELGKNNTTVYSSHDGYDEISSNDVSECRTIKDGKIETFSIDPKDYFTPFPMPVVETNDQAKDLFINGLKGSDEKTVNILALNSALALKTMGVSDLKTGFETTKKCINSGKAFEKLQSICNMK